MELYFHLTSYRPADLIILEALQRHSFCCNDFFNKTRKDFDDVAENRVHFVVTFEFSIFNFNFSTSRENSVDGKL